MARSVTTTVEVDAPAREVWAVLCDLDRYPEWHPHIREATGQVVMGSRVKFRMAPPGRRPFTIRPEVVAAEPAVELRLLGHAPVLSMLFSGEHSFVLSPIESSVARTQVVQGEIYRGLVVPLIGKTIAATRTEFDDVNQALKRRVEDVAWRSSQPVE